MTDETDAREGDSSKGAVATFLTRNTLPATLFAAFAFGCFIVFALRGSFADMRVAPALLWAFGFAAIGLLTGFIFGIPRVSPAPPDPANRDDTGQRRRRIARRR